jgi:hypothetical protein
MIQHFQIILKNQDQIYLIISTRTTQTPTALTPQHHYQYLPRPSNLHPLHQDHLRNPLWLDIAGKTEHRSMNWKNISSYLLKISMHASRFAGGLADEVNSQIFFAWHATSCVFLVSIQSHIGGSAF